MSALSFSNFKKAIANLGFENVNTVIDLKQYSIKGDNATVWLPLCENPYLFSFFGDDLESVKGLLQQGVQNDSSTYQKFKRSQLLTNKDNIFNVVISKSSWSEVFIHLQNQIDSGDFVVHEDHGVAKYSGLVLKNNTEYLLLEYFGEDRLYIPISQISKISKYIGATENPPKITKLNGGEWNRIRKKVKESVALIAKDLLIKMAMREISGAPDIYEPTSLYDQFCNDFQYNLTVDQQKAIDEIIDDITGKREPVTVGGIKQIKPMSRLLVADVGFGKTEVAARAAFLVSEGGYQVAVLCPTTILAVQHYKLFKDRFEKFGIRIGHISSFNTNTENKEILKNLENGNIEIIIGTHRLLQNDIKIPKLGLLVIDEEQKFGVKQKEKIKSLRFGVHLLSMSATPIPRTLSLALSKLQDISVITTPPPGRKPIITVANKLDWQKISNVIIKEISRGGQIYFVHNEVKTIYSIQHKLTTLLPNVRTAVAYSHTQFDKNATKIIRAHQLIDTEPRNLEQTIEAFYDKEYDILITTTIIENGIDMPNVNTIIINKSQNLGLSQLHQLRGRVGRSNVQGYCYLFYDEKITQNKMNKEHSTTKKVKLKNEKYKLRIETLENESELGSGFNIASRDLEIRGSGNILGKEQSGNINLIGYSMFIQMLDEEVQKIQ